MTIEPGIHEYEETIGDKRVRYLLDYKSKAIDLIVFVHGLACTKDTFRHAFNQRYFPRSSLLAIDLVGFGDSCKPTDYSYSMEDQALLYQRLLEKFAYQKLHVVAHSMGVAVALLFSPHTLKKTVTFVNIEGNLIAEDCNMLSRRIADLSYEEYESRMFPKQKTRFRNDILLRYDLSTPLAIYNSSVSLVRWSDSGELLCRYNELKCKKSYFWGESNVDMPVLGRLDENEKCMISNSGHAMMIENPMEFYSKLAEFITQAPGG
jgi:pimeloyl-ACP methyl ester carboxylesterase